jgi:hypothetical protein
MGSVGYHSRWGQWDISHDGVSGISVTMGSVGYQSRWGQWDISHDGVSGISFVKGRLGSVDSSGR